MHHHLIMAATAVHHAPKPWHTTPSQNGEIRIACVVVLLLLFAGLARTIALGLRKKADDNAAAAADAMPAEQYYGPVR